MRRSQAWKDLERETAAALRGKRIYRGADFSVSDTDVLVPDIPELKVDCKYKQAHSHHSLMAEIREKYCGDQGVPVLVTKSKRQHGACVTVPLEFFAVLLDGWRKLAELQKTNEIKEEQK